MCQGIFWESQDMCICERIPGVCPFCYCLLLLSPLPSGIAVTILPIGISVITRIGLSAFPSEGRVVGIAGRCMWIP